MFTTQKLQKPANSTAAQKNRSSNQQTPKKLPKKAASQTVSLPQQLPHQPGKFKAPSLNPEIQRLPEQPLNQSTQTWIEPRFNPRTHPAAPAAEFPPAFRNHLIMKKEEYTPLASRLQTKLSVGAAGDIYEPEADRVAEPVIGMAQPRENRKVSHHEFHPTLATAQSIARSIPVLQRQGTGGTTSPLTGLQNLLHLRFSLGTFNFNLDLPSQVTVSLPITLRNRQILEFRLIGETAGNFSFSATYDGIPQVRISLRAGITGVAGSSPQASAGLTIQTTRTTCHAPSPEATRASLQSAGERVKRAIEAVQNAPTEQEGETVIDVASRYAELAAAIANLHSAVERAQSLCTQVPVVTFDFGARTPLTPMQPGETNSNRAPYIGGGVTFHF